MADKQYKRARKLLADAIMFPESPESLASRLYVSPKWVRRYLRKHPDLVWIMHMMGAYSEFTDEEFDEFNYLNPDYNIEDLPTLVHQFLIFKIQQEDAIKAFKKAKTLDDIANLVGDP